jgi:hypothetical protein
MTAATKTQTTTAKPHLAGRLSPAQSARQQASLEISITVPWPEYRSGVKERRHRCQLTLDAA